MCVAAGFEAPWHEDRVTRKRVRPYQEMAVFETLYRFSQNRKRVLLLMATGTGKTFTVFQLVWKLFAGNVLSHNRVLFLTDRNSLKDQAYRAFSAFDANERVVIDKDVVARGGHLVGKIFFANYQNLDEGIGGSKLYTCFPPDFFGLVVVDECHEGPADLPGGAGLPGRLSVDGRSAGLWPFHESSGDHVRGAGHDGGGLPAHARRVTVE